MPILFAMRVLESRDQKEQGVRHTHASHLHLHNQTWQPRQRLLSFPILTMATATPQDVRLGSTQSDLLGSIRQIRHMRAERPNLQALLTLLSAIPSDSQARRLRAASHTKLAR